MCDGERVLVISGTVEQLVAGTKAVVTKLVADENALYYENPSVQYHSTAGYQEDRYARVRYLPPC
jgi:hypothetical protein